MKARRFLAGQGLAATLLSVVAGADIEIPRVPAAPPDGAWDRRTDLAALETLLTIHGDSLTTSERVEYQGQFDRLQRDEGAELDQRRRVNLRSRLRAIADLGLAV